MPVNLTLRRVKAAPLTNDEIDDNFENIKVAVETEEQKDVVVPDPGDLAQQFNNL